MSVKQRRPGNSSAPRGKSAPVEKKFNPITLFFKVVGILVFAFVFLAGGSCFAYYKITGNVPFSGDVLSTNATDANFLDALMKRNMKMNVAVFGVDKDGTRTDVNFVVHYDSAQESLSLVSIPRDTRISICDTVKADLNANGRAYNQVTKFNAVHSYSGKENGSKNAVLQLEDLLGIKIDHYVKVDLEAFRAIVDAVGGVDMYVPQDMVWDMRDTGDPYINLKEGQQHLDGDKAEQLVRFRRYVDGDVGRIKTQQAFLNALASKILSTETIVKKLPDMLSVVYKYIETDVSLTDAMKYINYADKIDMSKISMETLPGAGQTVGGVSYFLHDAEETRAMVDRVFYSVAPATSPDGTAVTDSKALLIEVSNGGNVSGLAGRVSETLTAQGYRLTTPTTYSGTQMEHTRIQVKTQGVGADLVAFFPGSQVEVAPTEVGTTADIRIVLGTNEK